MLDDWRLWVGGALIVAYLDMRWALLLGGVLLVAAAFARQHDRIAVDRAVARSAHALSQDSPQGESTS